MEVKKKVCVITGASGLLGRAFCRRFAAKYAIAAVCGRRELEGIPHQQQQIVDPLDPAAPLSDNDAQVFAINADLAAPHEIGRIVELALARFGRIDFLVNGAAHYVLAPMIEDDAVVASAERQFLVNVIAPLRLSVAIAHAYWRDRRAENLAINRCVVNVSSTSGLNVYPGLGQSVYSASKAALNYLTCHMADEFARIGVRVCGLAPTSFPSLVATDSVASAIDRLLESGAAGRLLVLEKDREYGSP